MDHPAIAVWSLAGASDGSVTILETTFVGSPHITHSVEGRRWIDVGSISDSRKLRYAEVAEIDQANLPVQFDGSILNVIDILFPEDKTPMRVVDLIEVGAKDRLIGPSPEFGADRSRNRTPKLALMGTHIRNTMLLLDPLQDTFVPSVPIFEFFKILSLESPLQRGGFTFSTRQQGAVPQFLYQLSLCSPENINP